MSLLVSLSACMNTENRLLGNTEELSEYLMLNITSLRWSKPFSEGWYKKLNAEHWTQVVFKDYVLILNTDCQSISARDDTELSLSRALQNSVSVMCKCEFIQQPLTLEVMKLTLSIVVYRWKSLQDTLTWELCQSDQASLIELWYLGSQDYWGSRISRSPDLLIVE